MAIRLDASADYLSRTADLPASTAFTIAGWFRRRGAGGAAVEVLSGLSRADLSSYYLAYVAGGTLYVEVNGAYTAAGAFSSDVWHFVALSSNGSGAGAAKIRRADVGATSLTTTTRAGASFVSQLMVLCGVGDPNYFGNFAVAGAKVWDRELSDSELLSEMHRLTPASTTNLNLWTPMVHNSVANAVKDFSGNGRDWTANGSLTIEDGPPIGWGGSIIVPQYAAGGGTTYNESLTESATVGDGLDPIASFFASYAESVAAGDSAANAQTHAAALSESVTPADSATSSQSHAETLAESVTADDSAASVQTMPVAFSEDVSAGDSADNAQTHAAAVAESVTPADSVTSAQGHTEALAESVTPADSAASAHAMPASVSEGVTTGDSVAGDVVPAGSFNETIAESATVAEVLATSQIHVTPLGETVAVGDAYAVMGGTEVAVSSGGGIDPDEALYAFTDWQRVKWKRPAARKKAQAFVAQLEREKKREPEDPIHARLIAERITQLQAQIAAQFDELVPHLQAHESKRQRQERNRRVIAAFLETI